MQTYYYPICHQNGQETNKKEYSTVLLCRFDCMLLLIIISIDLLSHFQNTKAAAFWR